MDDASARKKYPDAYRRADKKYRENHSEKTKNYSAWYYENVTKAKRKALKEADKVS